MKIGTGTGKTRDGTGLKLGEKNREVSTIKIGTSSKSRDIGTPSTAKPETVGAAEPTKSSRVEEVLHSSSGGGGEVAAPTFEGKRNLKVGVVVPWRSFGAREYMKAFNGATSSLERKRLGLFKKYQIQAEFDLKVITPSPTGKTLYNDLLSKTDILKNNLIC